MEKLDHRPLNRNPPGSGFLGRPGVFLGRPLRVLGFAASILVVGGCSSLGTTDDPANPPISPALLAELPESQAQILADGAVSDSEFEQALLGLVACLGNSGLDVTELDIGPTEWSLAYRSGFDDPTKDEAAYGTCYETHVEHVEAHYLADRQPTAEEREATRTAMIECLREANIEVHDDADWGEIDSTSSKDYDGWLRCAEASVASTAG